MKKTIENLQMSRVILLMAAFVGMTLTGCSTQESVTGPVSAGDVSNSGCLSNRGTSIIGNPTLKLTKDGVNLQAEFHDYKLNCAYKDAKVECTAKDGVLNIRVEEVMDGELHANCLCPVNIFCTIYNANEEEYRLKLNGEDYGIISFKGHNVTEIDLINHEQAHEEGLEYPGVLTWTYEEEMNPDNIEGREDKLPELKYSKHDNTLYFTYQFFKLPKEYNNMHVEGGIEGSNIVLKIIVDGEVTDDSPRRGNVAWEFANITLDTYHVTLLQQSLVKDGNGNLQEKTETLYDGNLDGLTSLF